MNTRQREQKVAVVTREPKCTPSKFYRRTWIKDAVAHLVPRGSLCMATFCFGVRLCDCSCRHELYFVLCLSHYDVCLSSGAINCINFLIRTGHEKDLSTVMSSRGLWTIWLSGGPTSTVPCERTRMYKIFRSRSRHRLHVVLTVMIWIWCHVFGTGR